MNKEEVKKEKKKIIFLRFARKNQTEPLK